MKKLMKAIELYCKENHIEYDLELKGKELTFCMTHGWDGRDKDNLREIYKKNKAFIVDEGFFIIDETVDSSYDNIAWYTVLKIDKTMT